MKFSSTVRRLLALLCLPALLCACSYGITDPIGDVSGDAESWAPLLSEDEAEALFGKASTSSSPQFQDGYYYFTAPLSKTSKQGTVYRYNVETDIMEYACRDTTCSHLASSACPFARAHGFTLICASGDGIAYRNDPGEGVEWYNCKTEEHIYLTKDADNCFRVGDTIYFDRAGIGFDPDDPHKFMHQLWRVDEFSEDKATLVAEEDESTAHINPYELNGEEVIIAFSSINKDGKLVLGTYPYRIDPETGEKSLFNERCIREIKTAGTHYMYYSLDTSVWEEDDTATAPCELCLTDVTTGETIVLAGSDEVEFSSEPFALTDRCAFWLKKNPDNENGMLLHCYDYIKGEKTVYPLEGKWTNGIMDYYRGRIYFSDAGVVPEPGETVDFSYLVIWDILTGKQHVLRDGEFVDA